MKDRRANQGPLSLFTSSSRQILLLFSAFFAGVFLGTKLNGKTPPTALSDNQIHGSVVHLEDLPFRDTSHAGIRKKQFIEPFLIPKLSGFQVAIIKSGQSVESHKHESMHEVFYVISGQGIFTIDGVDNEVNPGTMVHLAPHEWHSILAMESAQGDLVMAYFGVTV